MAQLLPGFVAASVTCRPRRALSVAPRAPGVQRDVICSARRAMRSTWRRDDRVAQPANFTWPVGRGSAQVAAERVFRTTIVLAGLVQWMLWSYSK